MAVVLAVEGYAADIRLHSTPIITDCMYVVTGIIARFGPHGP